MKNIIIGGVAALFLSICFTTTAHAAGGWYYNFTVTSIVVEASQYTVFTNSGTPTQGLYDCGPVTKFGFPYSVVGAQGPQIYSTLLAALLGGKTINIYADASLGCPNGIGSRYIQINK